MDHSGYCFGILGIDIGFHVFIETDAKLLLLLREIYLLKNCSFEMQVPKLVSILLYSFSLLQFQSLLRC